jgi:hemolysin III
MHLFDLREPVNAWSHGAGMMLALPVTWVLWKRCASLCGCHQLELEDWRGATRYQRNKALGLLIFGISLIVCYGVSAAFHAVRFKGEVLSRLQRLDHVGIYLLIAGTYTPVAIALLRGAWSPGTLATVWTVALVCASRVWYGGVLPIWLSTVVYLTMGWGALVCYCELTRGYSHKVLLPLPIGGILYSVGAVINLARWPIFWPGQFGSHELFHFFVIAGSASHIYFMLKVVVPATEPVPAPARRPAPELRPVPVFSRRTLWKPSYVWNLRWVGSPITTSHDPIDRQS